MISRRGSFILPVSVSVKSSFPISILKNQFTGVQKTGLFRPIKQALWLAEKINESVSIRNPSFRTSEDRFLAFRIEIERDPFLTEHVLEHMINRKCWYNDNRNAWCGNKMKLWWSRGVIRRQLKNLIVEIRTAPRLKNYSIIICI